MNKNMSLKKEKQSKVLIWVAILLGLLLIYNIVTFINEIEGHSYRTTNELSIMEYAIRDQDYPRLIDMVAENIARDNKTIGDTTEYVALAYYYETMMYYRIYENEDQDKASKFKEKAKEYRTQLKSERMLKEADKIDEWNPIE